MPFSLQVTIICVCAILWRLGGWDKARWSGWRDVLVPLLLGAVLSVVTVWWIGLITVAAFQIIRMGYGAYDPEHDTKPSHLAALTHDRSGVLIRGLYGLITSLVGYAPVAVYTGRWMLYASIAVLIALGEAALTASNASDTEHELLAGAMRAVGMLAFIAPG